MLRLSALFPLLFAHALSAQVRMPATTQADLARLKAMAVRHPDPAALTALTQGRYPTALVHGRCTVGFLGRVGAGFDPQAVDADMVHVGARVGDVVSFRVDAAHLNALAQVPGLAYAELAGKAAPTLDRLVKAARVDSVWSGIGLPQPYTGRDVLIGITDWGFDYTHPMFYDTLLTGTRVRATWDQYRQAGPAPAAYGYGTELLTPEDLLAAQADTANIYGHALHGSHVAGIAGGSGAGTPYRGVAFEADYLFCTFLVDAAAVLDAFAWMRDIAQQDQKRLVVNMSWGLYYIGTLDGHSLLSQAIGQLAQEGVVFVNSAGNNGDVDFHIRKDFTGDTLHTRIAFDTQTGNPNGWGESITLWGPPGGAFSARLAITDNSNVTVEESPWYATAAQPAYLDSFLVAGSDTIHFDLTAEAAHPLNGRPHFRLRVQKPSGIWKAALHLTAAEGVVHAWNVVELTNGVGNWGEPFTAPAAGWTAGDNLYGISEPACTEPLVTVAAYKSEYMLGQSPQGGQITAFSSFGPTLDERIKPDITAPGYNVISSINAFTDNAYTPVTTVDFNGHSYPFARLSGTSMAAPAVTGIVALMLEADPTLTPAEVRALIQATARTDSHTGTIPPGGSTRWGMGKVNAYRAVQWALGLTAVPGIDGPHLSTWPVPAAAEVNIASPFTGGTVRMMVLDATGRVVLDVLRPNAAVLTLRLDDRPAGLYAVRLLQEGRSATGRIIKQ